MGKGKMEVRTVLELELMTQEEQADLTMQAAAYRSAVTESAGHMQYLAATTRMATPQLLRQNRAEILAHARVLHAAAQRIIKALGDLPVSE